CYFQAEDGIRGRSVTGVQTCALPISFVYRLLFSRLQNRLYTLVQRHLLYFAAAFLFLFKKTLDKSSKEVLAVGSAQLFIVISRGCHIPDVNDTSARIHIYGIKTDIRVPESFQCKAVHIFHAVFLDLLPEGIQKETACHVLVHRNIQMDVLPLCRRNKLRLDYAILCGSYHIPVFSGVIRVCRLRRTAVPAFSRYFRIRFVNVSKSRIIITEQIHLCPLKRKMFLVSSVKEKNLVFHAPDTLPLYPDSALQFSVQVTESGYRGPKFRELDFQKASFQKRNDIARPLEIPVHGIGF